MALTFKKFGLEFLTLPATIFSGLLSVTFGSTQTDKEGQTTVQDGIVSFTLDFIKELGRGIADLAAHNKKAIAVAFWSSAAVAGGVALTLVLWPAALTAVANFSLFGFSIAGTVGANSLLQIGLAAGLAATATSVVSYFTDAVVNTINAIVKACTRAPQSSGSNSDLTGEEVEDSSVKMAKGLRIEIPQTSPRSEESPRQVTTAPLQSGSPIHTPAEQKKPAENEQNAHPPVVTAVAS